MAEKKYIDHKKFNSKLSYIIRAYGLSGVISEKIKKAIKESEAADVEPVKRGEWITINSISRCSNCEYIPPYDRAIDDIFYSAYCPNCGAKMDGEEVQK